MKLAIYKTDYGTELVFESDRISEDDKYIRISEIIDVPFVPRNVKEVAKKELAVIEKLIQTVQADAQVKLNALEQRKQELLALPSMSGNSEQENGGE